LRGLYEAAGRPTLAELVRLGQQQRPPAHVGISTVGDWLGAKTVPSGPDNQRYLMTLVAVLQARAVRADSWEPLSEGQWAQLLGDAQRERAAGRRNGRPRRIPDLPVTANAKEPAGSSVGQEAAGAVGAQPDPGVARVRSAYVEQVRRIAPPNPPGLVGREAELAELGSFCLEDGRGAYMWWQARGGAGEAAVVSPFVLHPPPAGRGRNRIGAFFLTAML